jgi:Fur family peroxide stress response transcriptional regulator
MPRDTPDTRLAVVVERLRGAGCRITPQRLGILRVLADSSGHPSAETIHRLVAERFPTMSLATVYKTLAVLKAAGEVLELEFSDRDNRYDGHRPKPHPHCICLACGAIVDQDLDSLDALTRTVAARTGFLIRGHRLDFYGLCPTCRRNEPNVP